MKILNYKIHSGFTLVELLVVVAIVGLLSAVAIAAFSSSRVSSRDAKRQKDIKAIQTALEAYYSVYNRYPLSVAWSSSSNDLGRWDTLQNALRPYLAGLPVDPAQSETGTPLTGPSSYSYAYRSLNTNVDCYRNAYVLIYRLENPTGPDPGVVQCNGVYLQYGTGVKSALQTLGNKAK